MFATMFLIHGRNRDLRNSCHNSRVAAHKTELIAPKRPRETSTNANKSSSHFSTFYLHIYAVLFPFYLLSPSYLLKLTRQTIRLRDIRIQDAERTHYIRSLEFFLSAKLKVRFDRVLWMKKKRNQSHNEILRYGRHADRWNFKKGFAKGLHADFTRIWKDAKGVAFCRISPATSEMTVNRLGTSKGFQKGSRNNLDFPRIKRTLFPSWEKFIIRFREQSERPV